ncbi:MAG TPA: PQQ-dependent catabolism-associated beta-propeller protein [Allosphingosinicella sp.]|jgi:PQQ-dependent catabolism-associated beta-propeller protein|nr:PQQ-dependent catabolism-associated beta-propeller protein [Allosphingosinicella sp.]
MRVVSGLLLLAASAAQASCSRPRGPSVFVSNEQSSVIHVIDAHTLAERASIAVGKRPRGMAMSPDGKILYVAVSDDDRIAAVDAATGKVGFYLPSGPDPETLAVSPDGRTLYVANEDDSLLTFIDSGSRRIVREVAVGGEPEGTAVSPDGRTVVQTSESASMAHVVETATARVADNILVDTRPRFVAFTPDGRQFWISSEVRGTVTIFDTATRAKLGQVDFQEALKGERPADQSIQPVAIAFTRDGGRAFVALGRAKLVAEVDPRTLAVRRTFGVGWRAWNLALSPDEARLYTANGLSGDMSVVDLAANRIVATVKLGGKPWGVVASR